MKDNTNKKPPEKGAGPRKSKVHQLSQHSELYTPKKREREKSPPLTVDQYLRKVDLDKGISDLVRSLHKTEIMQFEEWSRKVTALLKQQTQ